jgi:hypothetical protein
VKAALRAAFSLNSIYAVECGVCFWAAGSTGRRNAGVKSGHHIVKRQSPKITQFENGGDSAEENLAISAIPK